MIKTIDMMLLPTPIDIDSATKNVTKLFHHFEVIACIVSSNTHQFVRKSVLLQRIEYFASQHLSGMAII